MPAQYYEFSPASSTPGLATWKISFCTERFSTLIALILGPSDIEIVMLTPFALPRVQHARQVNHGNPL